MLEHYPYNRPYKGFTIGREDPEFHADWGTDDKPIISSYKLSQMLWMQSDSGVCAFIAEHWAKLTDLGAIEYRTLSLLSDENAMPIEYAMLNRAHVFYILPQVRTIKNRKTTGVPNQQRQAILIYLSLLDYWSHK